jgi:nitrite reductase (NADH) small subunit
MWVEVGTTDELAKARKKVVQAGDRSIVVIWHDGQPYAFDNICIHKQRELVGGVILNGRLVCPGHQWAYELGTGYCRERDRFQPVFAVRVDGDKVYVEGGADGDVHLPDPVDRPGAPADA